MAVTPGPGPHRGRGAVFGVLPGCNRMANGGATGGPEIEVMAAGQGPLTLRNTMNRIAALAVTAAATAATLAAIAGGASAATTPAPATTTTAAAVTPGIGAMLWAGSNQITVTPGSTKTIYVAFYSTGPRETAAVSTAVTTTGAHAAAVRTAAADISIPAADATITLPAKPAAPVTMVAPNGAGGYEGLTSSTAYVFVPVTITVPAGAAAYTYTSGDANETITGQVQTAPAAGITTSPGAGIALALSTH